MFSWCTDSKLAKLGKKLIPYDIRDTLPRIYKVQYNLNSSNPDGSFIMASSNSFLNPYEILRSAQNYIGKFSHFIIKLYVVYTNLVEAILMSTLNIPLLYKRAKDFPKLLSFIPWPGGIINS